MKIRTIARLGLALAIAVIGSVAATPARAQVQPGVGFDPPAVGQLTSRYYI